MRSIFQQIRRIIRIYFKPRYMRPRPPETRRGLVLTLRLAFSGVAVITVIAAYTIDPFYIRSVHQDTAWNLRALLCLYALVAVVLTTFDWGTRWMARHWQGFATLYYILYAACFSFLDRWAVSPLEAAYYQGILAFIIGAIAFRVFPRMWIAYALMLVYVIIAWDSPTLIDLAFEFPQYLIIGHGFVFLYNYYFRQRELSRARQHRLQIKLERARTLVALERRRIEELQRIATMSHGWKVPLQFISHFVGRLRLRLKGRDRDLARLLQYHALFIRSQAAALITSSRDGMMPARPTMAVRLKPALYRAALAVIYIREHRVELRGPVPQVFLELNRDHADQVFCNLLDNAAAYSDGDQPVTVSFAPMEAEAGFVEIIIENHNSRGIPPSVLEAGAPAAGNGIGLSMVRDVVSTVGGHLKFTLEQDVIKLALRLPCRSNRAPTTS